MNDPLSKEEIQALLNNSPFISFMNLKIESLDPDTDTLVMRMPMRPEFERRAGTGQWHGGPIASLIDTVGDYAVVMKGGAGVPTVNFRTDYLRPGINTDLIATAKVRRAGRSIAVVDIDVHDENGKLLAVGRGTYVPQAG